MPILCDTCVIFMVYRIAPTLFTDPAFDCTTIQSVIDEMYRVQKFKEKYPWRSAAKKSIKQNHKSIQIDRDLQDTVEHIANNALDSKGRPYTVGATDRKIICEVIENKFEIVTGDTSLILFLAEQFEIQAISALRLVNTWLSNKLIVWDEDKQSICREWNEFHERPQTKADIKEFEKLTGFKYAGS